MQSSMLHFCDECGAANADDATACVACQKPLPALKEAAPALVAPVTIAPATPLEVTAGSPATSGPLGRGTLLAGRYRILREIGQGGFGSVYRARDLRQHGRLVAIKQIDLSKLKPQEIIEATDSFNREVTLLSSLKHPGLPKFYQHFTDANHWYLVMEYIKGHTLEEYLKRSRKGYLPLRKAMRIGEELANVLTYLHSQKPAVIFRDVKPANIMLTRTGRVYLIDFGIARRYSPAKKRDTGPLGSPGYAAPEQYGSAQTNQKTDMYGLGATLQTLLTGREPLELRLGQPSPRSKPLPADLQALLASLLEADPARRPPDMMTVAEKCEKLNRRGNNLRDLVKGLLIGSIFSIIYCIVALWAPATYGTYNPKNPALSLFDTLVLLETCLRLVAAAGIVGFLLSLILGKNSWVLKGILVMLIITLFLAFFVLPIVYVPPLPYP